MAIKNIFLYKQHTRSKKQKDKNKQLFGFVNFANGAIGVLNALHCSQFCIEMKIVM